MSSDEGHENENTIDCNLGHRDGGGVGAGRGEAGLQGFERNEQLLRRRQLGEQLETAGSGRGSGGVDHRLERCLRGPFGRFRRAGARSDDGLEQGSPRQTGGKAKATERKEQAGRRKISGGEQNQTRGDHAAERAAIQSPCRGRGRVAQTRRCGEGQLSRHAHRRHGV